MTRSNAAIGAAITIAVGIASRRFPIGVFVWDKSLGDGLYTVMIYFFVAFLRPSWRPHLLGLVALAISIAIELFQLTGIPLKLPRIFQIVLGTSFALHDIACYIVGAFAVSVAHYALSRPRGE